MWTELHVATGYVTGDFWSSGRVLASSLAVPIAIGRKREWKVGWEGKAGKILGMEWAGKLLILESDWSLCQFQNGNSSPINNLRPLQACNFPWHSSETEFSKTCTIALATLVTLVSPTGLKLWPKYSGLSQGSCLSNEVEGINCFLETIQDQTGEPVKGSIWPTPRHSILLILSGETKVCLGCVWYFSTLPWKLMPKFGHTLVSKFFPFSYPCAELILKYI